MKIAVLGYGVVGSGVVEVLFNNGDSIAEKTKEKIEIKYIVDIRDFPDDPHAELFTKNFEDVINDAENKANTPKVTVTVEETFKNVGKLEVLTAEVKTYYEHEKGNYAALYILNGDGVFTVDLSKAQFEIDENIVNIKLPRPALDIRFKDLPKKIAEYEGFDFLVSSDDAYKGYTAAQTELIKNIKDKMVNYHMLLESAENSAKKSMKLLVQSIKGNDVEITIDFTGEGEVHAE